jgi:putative nucleotidyltransferase with HDIG domain
MDLESRHRRRVIAFWLAVLTAAHLVVPAAVHSWHWLHTALASAYLPVIFAATMWFGRRGGLICAAAAAALYLAHLLIQWSRSGMLNPDQFAFPAIFLLVAFAAGRVVEDSRRKRWERDEVVRRERQTALRNGIAGLVAARDARDPVTRQHSLRVANLAMAIGRRMGLPQPRLELLQFAGLLHDVGKLGSSGEPEPLHPETGAELLRKLDDGGELAEIVRAHHECPDGTGYPRGLTGTQIPPEARILRVADAFAALTEDRPGQPALTESAALVALRELAGTKVDSACFSALRETLSE